MSHDPSCIARAFDLSLAKQPPTTYVDLTSQRSFMDAEQKEQNCVEIKEKLVNLDFTLFLFSMPPCGPATASDAFILQHLKRDFILFFIMGPDFLLVHTVECHSVGILIHAHYSVDRVSRPKRRRGNPVLSRDGAIQSFQISELKRPANRTGAPFHSADVLP